MAIPQLFIDLNNKLNNNGSNYYFGDLTVNSQSTTVALNIQSYSLTTTSFPAGATASLINPSAGGPGVNIYYRTAITATTWATGYFGLGSDGYFKEQSKFGLCRVISSPDIANIKLLANQATYDALTTDEKNAEGILYLIPEG